MGFNDSVVRRRLVYKNKQFGNCWMARCIELSDKDQRMACGILKQERSERCVPVNIPLADRPIARFNQELR